MSHLRRKLVRFSPRKYTDLFSGVVGFGLMRGLRARDQSVQKAVIKHAMQEGLIVLKAGRNTVRFLPSLTITQAEIDEGFERLRVEMMRL